MSRVKSFSIPALLLVLSALFLTGCVSLGYRQPVSRNLSDPAIKNQNQLVKFFMKQNPEADKIYRIGRSGIYELDNKTDIRSFMIVPVGGNVNSFLLDYAYES